MYSDIRQEKTSRRDAKGGTVYRKIYLCDTEEDIPHLPKEDAVGSLCYVAQTGEIYVLDHTPAWRCGGKGMVPWSL